MRRRLVTVFSLSLLLAGCGLPDPRDAADSSGNASESQAAAGPGATVLVIDASGTMKQDDVSPTRMAAAKSAATTILDGLPDQEQVALLTYGTGTGNSDAEKQAGCRDVTVAVELAALDGTQRDGLGAAVEGLQASGYTPIGLALTRAAEQLPDGAGQIVLISDGEDTCAPPDPCETAAQLRADHPDLVINTVGFRTEEAASKQLSCIAAATGGQYMAADDAEQLSRRASSVATQDPGGQARTPALSTSGLGPIQLGQTVEQIRRTTPDFPAAATAEEYTGSAVPGSKLTVIVWQDCDYVFDADGELVGIVPKRFTNVDGFTVGQKQTELTDAWGDPVDSTRNDDGSYTVLYPADKALGYAYRLRLSAAPGSAESIVEQVVLCRCLDSGPGSDGPARTIVYDPSVEITSPSDVDKLEGAPADFKAYIRTVYDEYPDPQCPVSVDRVRTDGWATGVSGGCGGYTVIWGKVDGSWREVTMGQDTWSCSLTRDQGVPKDIYLDCTTDY